MTHGDDLSGFVCPKCSGTSIKLYTRYGRKQCRLLICSSCDATFSELKGTPLWNSRLDWPEIASVLLALAEGQKIRTFARSAGRAKNTVKRYRNLAKGKPKDTLFALRKFNVVTDHEYMLIEGYLCPPGAAQSRATHHRVAAEPTFAG